MWNSIGAPQSTNQGTGTGLVFGPQAAGPAAAPGAPAAAPPKDGFTGSGEQDDPAKDAEIKYLEQHIQQLQGQLLGLEQQPEDQNAQERQQQEQALEQEIDKEEQQLYDLTGGKEGYSGNNTGSQAVGGNQGPTVSQNGGGAPSGSYGGPGPNAGGVSPNSDGPGNTAQSPNYPTAAPGSGEDTVNLAKTQLGKLAQNVNLRNYTAAGGRTNDCADFVSAVLSDTGRFNKRSADVGVDAFRNDLLAQGYRQVPLNQARPGDVFFSTRYHHTELVAGRDGSGLVGIGSNGSGQQRVTENHIGSGGNPGFVLQRASQPSAPSAPAAPAGQ